MIQICDSEFSMKLDSPSQAQPGRSHDHDKCVDRALGDAEAICEERGVRLTPLRQKVLELVWSGHKPISAYDLLDKLSENRKKAAPPTVYRALEFLMNEGLVHRIESLNAYIGCPHPFLHHNGQFLICQTCKIVLELNDPAIRKSMTQLAHSEGFTITSGMVEVMGVCPACQASAAAGPVN